MGEVSEHFDRDYDQSACEEKIGRLAQSFCARVKRGDTGELRLWKEAIQTLRKEDHYLLVLIAAPRGSALPGLRVGKLAILGALFALAVLLAAFLLIGT